LVPKRRRRNYPNRSPTVLGAFRDCVFILFVRTRLRSSSRARATAASKVAPDMSGQLAGFIIDRSSRNRFSFYKKNNEQTTEHDFTRLPLSLAELLGDENHIAVAPVHRSPRGLFVTTNRARTYKRGTFHW